ncbi:hypothetical protein SDC9_208229 [bioreactor metagenome]|uniref:Uncharacterized protein n=1 Tax=bioreactor metagenome TaxID=1076179 RepID=A0A645JA60_9ZZZZ
MSPSLSLSSLPTGKRRYLSISGGRMSITVRSLLSSTALSTPQGLLKIRYFCSTGEISLPSNNTTSLSMTCLPGSVTTSPLIVTFPARMCSSTLRLAPIPQRARYLFSLMLFLDSLIVVIFFCFTFCSFKRIGQSIFCPVVLELIKRRQ